MSLGQSRSVPQGALRTRREINRNENPIELHARGNRSIRYTAAVR
jgi:hypothetical protein